MAKQLKSEGKKISALSGSFDLLHIGHIKSIKEAKRKGDILIVLLNSDKSIRSYKGINHPLNSEKERLEVLSALQAVDYVSIFNELTPENILSEIKPDVYCNSSDWGKNCIERKVVEKNGGRVHVLKWEKGFSTTSLVEKILKNRLKPDIKAVFLDRDGTININKPEYLYRIEDFKFVPGMMPALKKISKTRYKIIIATNQSGIGRGYFSEKDLRQLHSFMIKKLKEKGVRIDKIYYCPHAPWGKCLCRKPGTEMFLQAAEDFGINLSKSFMIGDDERDVIAARYANIKAIKIGKKMPKSLKIEPNYYAKNLSEAVNIILHND